MTRRSAISLVGIILLCVGWVLPAVAFAQTPATCIPMEESEECLPTAPESDLVDREQPVFSDPTSITNPLFPISNLESVVMLGRIDRLPFRTEVTLLPETKFIDWNGQQIETLVSQYLAYLDGRIVEVALDYYAQADDGSVWYFGEDVFNYEDGEVADIEGTWLAGEDGPAAMIMPADPLAGDVYRPENIPGLVYEEVTVLSIDETVIGPLGPTEGAIVVQELHQDGSYEGKIFAPGYGEFLTGQEGELEALALAVPADRLNEALPAGVETLATGALDMFDAAETDDWTTVEARIDEILAAWTTYQATGLPHLLENQMSTALVYLIAAVDAHQPEETRQAAIDVARAAFDLQLQFRPATEIDLARFDLMARQVLVDTEAEDSAGIAADVTTLEWIWDRIAHTVDQTENVESHLADLRSAADEGDVETTAESAEKLLDQLSELQ